MNLRLPTPRPSPLALTGIVAFALSALPGCQSAAPTKSAEPLKTVAHVDLPRFMGDWYVIANIPTFLERGAHNSVESYSLNEDGTIATTFTFNRNAPDGPVRTLNPKGFVHDRTTNAEWRMQFLWPFKAAYLILYLDDTYETTIVGVPSRKYVWVMARTPTIPDAKYQEMVTFLDRVGYDTSKLQKVPQQPAR